MLTHQHQHQHHHHHHHHTLTPFDKVRLFASATTLYVILSANTQWQVPRIPERTRQMTIPNCMKETTKTTQPLRYTNNYDVLVRTSERPCPKRPWLKRPPFVEIISDHRLLRWSCGLHKPVCHTGAYTSQPRIALGDDWMWTGSVTSCVSRRCAATWRAPTSTSWWNCMRWSCLRFSIAFFRCARQHAVVDRLTCNGSTTTAVSPNATAGNWKRVSISGETTVTSSLGSVKCSGGISLHNRVRRQDECGSRSTIC